MPEHKHFGQVESIEPTGHSCPICETPILKIVHHDKDLPGSRLRTYIACECMAEQDFFGEAVMVSDKGFHQSIREIWGEEVLYMMRTRPDMFPPDSMLGPIDLTGASGDQTQKGES
jgi:hypothetical protein